MKEKYNLLSDDALFHFTNRITFMEKIIPNNCFLLNQLKNTNDPQEYRNYEFEPTTSLSIKDLLFLCEIQNEINNYFKNYLQIGCFCSYKKGELRNTWLKPKLWSDFGDGHKGVCLIFSKKSIQLELNNLDLFHGLKDVSYYYNTSMLPSPEIDLYKKLGNLKFCNQFIKNNIGIVFQKDIDYEIENECRCYAISENNHRIELDLQKILKGIIIGDRFPEIYDEVVIQHFSEIDLYKIEYLSGVGYRLINYY